MSGTESYDVAVVGASIAGCTAATLLARSGARVALLEQRPDPAAYKTVCTHFIQPSATPTIERLGLAERIEAAGGLRNAINLWTRYGWVRLRPGESYRYPRYGYDIRREKLDPLIRQLAAETPGVDLMLGHHVTGLVKSADRPVGVRVTGRDREEQTIGARVVVAADGRDSQIGELAGIKPRVMPHGRFGYFAYYRDLPLASGPSSQMWLLDPDIAYAFAQDDGLTLLAVFLTSDRISWFKQNLEENFEHVFQGLPEAPDLGRAERVSKIIGKLDMANTYRRAAVPGLAFVGDAAMAADPVWGVGCGFAFQSGAWLADALGPVIGSGSDEEIDAALDRYRKQHRTRMLGHFFFTSDYATGRPFNPLERILFAASAKDQRCAEDFFAFGSRAVRPNDREFLRLIGRSLRVVGPRPKPVAESEVSGPHSDGKVLPAGISTTQITVDGITTPVSSAGDPDSPEAVVFVHGNPGSRRDWDDLLVRASGFARAVAFDMPGFGRAERPAGFEYTVPGYARFLGAALKELGVERAHLVLHDLGGPWGLEWASEHPDEFASAALINTGVWTDYRWHYLARIWRTPVAGEMFQATTTRGGLRMALRHGNPRGLPRAFVDRMYDDIDAGTKRAVLRLYRDTDDPAAMGRRQADRLRPLNRPALVVWGAKDPYLPVALAERQREAFPEAEVVVLEDSGHWPFADNPDAVGKPVEAFLRRTVAAEQAVTAA